MNVITITNKGELIAHYTSIEALFKTCFNSQLSRDLWNWLYIENPQGQPIVSLCYDKDVLVGHYAIVPMTLTTSSSKCNSYLSVTTMVAASHRVHGLLENLGENTYKKAQEFGVDIDPGLN